MSVDQDIQDIQDIQYIQDIQDIQHIQVFKKQKIDNDHKHEFQRYANMHNMLMYALDPGFRREYTEWLIRDCAGLAQPAAPGHEMIAIVRERVDLPLYRFAVNHLGMDDVTIERAKAYMIRPETRSDDVNALLKLLVEQRT